MQSMFSTPHQTLAVWFTVFWLVTVGPAQRNIWLYLYKTPVVVVYSLITWDDHHRWYSAAEWTADGLVWLHFFSVIYFLPGSPMNSKRGLSG